MNLLKLRKNIFGPLLFSFSFAYADKCPTPLYKVDPKIESKITYDKKNNLYRYDYTLTNVASSMLPIHQFMLFLSESPKSVNHPAGWDGDFMDNDPKRVSWMNWGKLAPNGVDTIYPNEIKPGKTLTGFSLTSSRPPGLVKFIAEGRLEFVPTSVATAKDDEPIPNCEGLDFGESEEEFPMDLIGMVEGPSDPNLTTVKIQLKDEIEELLKSQDKKNKKNAELIVFGDENFDVSRVDISSVRFGTGKAEVLTSKNLPIGSDRDDHKDNKGDVKKTANKMLVLTFDPEKIGVRCERDMALFLTGNFGKNKFIGGVPIKKQTCRKGELKKNKLNRKLMDD